MAPAPTFRGRLRRKNGGLENPADLLKGSEPVCVNGNVDVFLGRKILFGPGKAANAGGVSVSGLEMSQNSIRLQWSSNEVDKRLSEIMKAIHNQCARYGEQDGWINYVNGANTAGFRKVAEAMLDQGLT